MKPVDWVVSALIASLARWLNPRRLRAQAMLLGLCLWGVCAVDYSTPGLFDRAGNIKFQDFLPSYISARLIAQRRAAELYDAKARTDELHSIVPEPTRVRLVNVYGPQVGLLFIALARLSFLKAAFVWAVFNLTLYLACIYAVWRCLPNLRPHRAIVITAAFAFPPLFHFFVRGQFSVLVLLCFTLAFLSLRKRRNWLAGVALGCMIFKPQFLLAIPLILLLSRSWSILAGLVLSSFAQLVFARLYFGPAVMQTYFALALHPSTWIGVAELSLAPIQMHSLRSFWSLLIAWHQVAFVLYLLCSALVLGVAVIVWKSTSELALRYSALSFAAILVNPHLFVYDLLMLAPALLILVEWSLDRGSATRSVMSVLLYLSFVLPLAGPLSRWTHLQLSVIAFAAVLGLLYRVTTRNQVLASRESLVI
ncbi:MAG TPA: glycosyltransferase family 87 protein [Candidatus Sulfotelmatobacter sp.]